MLAVDTLSITPFVMKKPLIDTARDFEPITNVFFLTVGFTVNPSLGVNTLQEFIAMAKAKPGTMNYGSTANNVAMFMNEFNRVNGTDLRYIPYKGGGDAVNALLGNQVQALVFGIGNLVGHLKSGKLKTLAVDGTQRSPLLPEVPTLAESGYRGVALRAWFGILGPAGIPKPIVARLRQGDGRAGVSRQVLDAPWTGARAGHAGAVRSVPPGRPHQRREAGETSRAGGELSSPAGRPNGVRGAQTAAATVFRLQPLQGSRFASGARENRPRTGH
jgi:hypothetical protein